MTSTHLTTISPITCQPILHTPTTQPSALNGLITAAQAAQTQFYGATTLERRKQLVSAFLDALERDAERLGRDLTEEMGRPIRYTAGEVRTAVARGRYLVGVADEVLVPQKEKGDEGELDRWIERVPLGIVFVVFAWNYPYLILINSLVPALLAGNALLLKPSPQTPTIVESIISLLVASGFPTDLVQPIHSGDPSFIASVIAHPQIPHTVFTGSFPAGVSVQQAALSAPPTRDAPGFKTFSLELGGNDPAYVRPDVDPAWAAEQIVDGAIFNSGQSCCAIERVYVHEDVYEGFVREVGRVVGGYVLGDPREEGTMLGPVVSAAAAKRIRGQIDDALRRGARSLTPAGVFEKGEGLGETFVRPEILVDVTDDMAVMRDETFGPVIPIMKVRSDEEAVRLMNASEWGLTASVWTRDEEAGRGLVESVEAGTVYVNRCDYPDPMLAWTGHKNSGRGHSLSRFGFEQFARLKSYHIKKCPS